MQYHNMANNIPKSNDFIVLLLFDNTYIKLDWILPVIFKLKKEKQSWHFIAVLSQNSNLNETDKNSTLDALRQIADKIVQSKKEIDVLISYYKKSVRLIMHNFYETSYMNRIKSHFPYGKVVLYPDETDIAIIQRFNSRRKFNDWKDTTPNHDLMLISTLSSAQYCFEEYFDAKICIVGSPKYDPWWINKLCESQKFQNSIELRKSKKAEKVFLFIDSGPTKEMPADIYEYMVESILNTVFSYNNSILLIKPEPDQDLSIIMKILSQYDSDRWIISSFNTIQLASISQMGISVTSSMILDVLVMEKPVIEYNQFIDPSEAFNVDKDGRMQSRYNLLGMSVRARTKDDIKLLVQDYFSNNNNPIWKNQFKAFKEYFPQNDIYVSQRTAYVIMNLIDPREGLNLGVLPAIYKGWSPITNDQNFFLDKKIWKLKFKLTNIDGIAIPINFNVLKELRDFFECDIFIATGTVNIHLIKAANKLFKKVYFIESSSDLYQPASFNVLQNCNNLHIINSKKILKYVLQNIDGKILFWLSSHDGCKLTKHRKTNTPIIEELEVIKESNIYNSIILMNNMKYFQPIKEDPFETGISRKYPSSFQAYKIMLEINKNYAFAVLGNIAIAYISDNSVSMSKPLKAITISQLYLNANEAINAEEFIAFHLKGNERELLKHMYKDNSSFEEDGIGGLYNFWSGLIYYGEKNYSTAQNQFIKAVENGFNSQRAQKLIAKCSIFLNK